MQEQDRVHLMVSRRGNPCLCMLSVMIYASIAANSPSQPKMTYASSKEALKNALPGLGPEVQANTDDEIEYGSILQSVSKGAR